MSALKEWDLIPSLRVVRVRGRLPEEIRATSQGEFIKITTRRQYLTQAISMKLREVKEVKRWSDGEKIKKEARELASEIFESFRESVLSVALFETDGLSYPLLTNYDQIFLLPRSESAEKCLSLALANAESSLANWVERPETWVNRAFCVEDFNVSQDAAFKLFEGRCSAYDEFSLIDKAPSYQYMLEYAKVLGVPLDDPYIRGLLDFVRLGNWLAEEKKRRNL